MANYVNNQLIKNRSRCLHATEHVSRRKRERKSPTQNNKQQLELFIRRRFIPYSRIDGWRSARFREAVIY